MINRKYKGKFIWLNLTFSSACTSVGENPDLCASLKCYSKLKKYLALIIISCIIAVLLPILMVALVIYKRRKRRGKSLISLASITYL